MTEENSKNQIIVSASAVAKIGAVVFLILTVAVSYFGISRHTGNLLAEATPPTDPAARFNAELAVSLAPTEPLSHWLLGHAVKNSFTEESLKQAIPHFENAVRTSPNDYRFWIDLGKTREQNGETESAERAFVRAVELAPNYALPRWNYGNFLLRAGKTEQSFAEFRRVAETHSTLRNQVFSVIWEFLRENPAELEKIVGNSPQVRAALVMFYAGRDFPNDALRQYQSLSEAEREDYKQVIETAARALHDKRRFRAALDLVRDLKIEPEADFAKIQNASFEAPITEPAKSWFNWRVWQIKNLQVSLDASQGKEGKRSLRLNFTGFTEPTLQNATQFVVVEKGARYRLDFAVKTNELKSAGLPLLEITDTDKFKEITASEVFPSGTGDWKNFALEFTAPSNSDAVMLRVGRNFCGEGCPIVGTVWLDDFKLQKIR